MIVILFFRIISQLATSTQQLLTLLLGIWFRMVNHSEYNTMSSEAVAVSVASCLFHVRGRDVRYKERAVQLLQILIDDFSMVHMLGRENVRYFAEITRTRISRPAAPRRNVSSDSPLVKSTLQFEEMKHGKLLSIEFTQSSSVLI